MPDDLIAFDELFELECGCFIDRNGLTVILGPTCVRDISLGHQTEFPEENRIQINDHS